VLLFVRRCGSCDNLFFTFEAALGSSQWANDEFRGDQCIMLQIISGSKLVGYKDHLCSRPLNLDVRMLFLNNLYVRRLAVLLGIVFAEWIRLLED